MACDNTDDTIPAGTVGRILSHHKGDAGRGYGARAQLLHDSPAGQRSIRVELLENYYCMDEGAVISHPRRLFTPEGDTGGAATTGTGGEGLT